MNRLAWTAVVVIIGLATVLVVGGHATLHIVADFAVVVAVMVGLVELSGHRSERRERTAAVDAHIRVLAIQARLVLQRERSQGRSLPALMLALVNEGALPGHSLVRWLTSVAAEAPQASPPVGRKASEASELFFHLLEQEQKYRVVGLPESVAAKLQGSLDQLEARLTGIAALNAHTPVSTRSSTT